MAKRMIIINRMYAGGYLSVGENIGHEVINLIKSDNGANYIWLNAGGNCEASKFNDYDEIIMLMVRRYSLRQWKILAKAEIDPKTLPKYMVRNYGKKGNQEQKALIKEEKIVYGGKPLDKIFANNSFNGEDQSEIDIYLTFKASNVLQPIQTPENIAKTVLPIKDLSGLSNQSLRTYLTEEKNGETFHIFNEIVEGKRFEWESENTTQIVNPDALDTEEEKNYFLKIINEEDRELTFSNLLAYFLKNKKIMEGFAEDVLKVKGFDVEAYSIAREEKNIDLFIASSNLYVILENKIRSGLIRETKPMDKKIEEYFGEYKNSSEAKELKKAFEQKSYYQTDRYYVYVRGLLAKRKSDAKIKGFVLVPNYAELQVKKELESALFKENYTLLTYDEVHDYFSSVLAADWLKDEERIYLKEFLWAMKKHTKKIDNNLEDEMKRRFNKMIKG